MQEVQTAVGRPTRERPRTTAQHSFIVLQPWFSRLKEGSKTVEVRLRRTKSTHVQVDDNIEFLCPNASGCASVMRTVQAVQMYESLRECLAQEGLARCLPGVDSLDEALCIYRAFYSEDDERQHGVVAWRLT